jgi:O-antigen/teichoic acid export membrane protein
MSTVSRSVKNSNPTSNREDDFKLTTYASTVAATCIPLVVVELIILIIGKQLSFEEAGAFRIGLIISSATVFTLTLVNAKEAYKFAELRAKAAMKRWRLYVRYTKLSAVASLPIFIFLFFFIDDLVLRIWGEKLLVYVESMKVILVAGMLNVAFGPIGMVLIMSHKERILIYSGIISISPIVIAYILELGYNGLHTMSMLYLLHVFLLNSAMLIMSIKEGVMRVNI